MTRINTDITGTREPWRKLWILLFRFSLATESVASLGICEIAAREEMVALVRIVPDNPICEGRISAIIQPQPDPNIEAAYTFPELSGIKAKSNPIEIPLKKNGVAKIMKWEIRMKICAGSMKTA